MSTTEPTSVWVIEREDQGEGWNGLSTSYDIDPDYGFYLTKSEAAAKCSALLEATRGPAYASYVQRTEEQNRQVQKSYDSRMLDYLVLKEAGRPATEPSKPVPEPILSREEWENREYRWHYTRYNPIELTRGG